MRAAVDLARVLFDRDLRRLIVLAALIYGVALYSLVLPLLFALAIDVLLPHALAAHLIAVVVVALLLAALRFCLAFVQDYEFQRLRQRCERRVIGRVLAAVLAHPDDPAVAGETSRLDDWLRLWLVNFQYQMTEILFFAAYAVLISLTVTAVIWWVDPVSGALMLVVAGLHTLNFRYHSRRSSVHARDYSTAKTAFVRDFAATLAAKRAVNLARLDDRMVDQLSAKAGQAFAAGQGQAVNSASQALVQSILRGALYLLVVAISAPQIAAGTMTVGEMLLVLMLVSFAYEPVYRLNQITVMFNQLVANSEPLRPFLGPEAQVEVPLTLGPTGPVTLSGVSAGVGGAPLFKPVTAHLQAGQVVLLRGPSGVGKSTLLKVLAGTESPAAGAVRWAGGGEDGARPSVYQMPQSATLFDAGLVENISLFEPEPDRVQIVRLLASLGMGNSHHADRTGSDVARLSQGERQRVALARALYSKAHLLLLDEPTAHLDHATEQVCLAAIRAAGAGRVIVLVSHGVQKVEVADDIITLEQTSGA